MKCVEGSKIIRNLLQRQVNETALANICVHKDRTSEELWWVHASDKLATCFERDIVLGGIKAKLNQLIAAVIDVFRSRNDHHDADWFLTAFFQDNQDLDPLRAGVR